MGTCIALSEWGHVRVILARAVVELSSNTLGLRRYGRPWRLTSSGGLQTLRKRYKHGSIWKVERTSVTHLVEHSWQLRRNDVVCAGRHKPKMVTWRNLLKTREPYDPCRYCNTVSEYQGLALSDQSQVLATFAVSLCLRSGSL